MKAVIIYDDVALAAGEKIEADRTRHLVVDGEEYELDLAEATSGKLDEALAPWIKVGRRTGQVGGSAPAHSKPGAGMPREYLKAFRDWAEAQQPPRSYRTGGGSYYYKAADLKDFDAWLSDQAAKVHGG